MKAFWLRYRGTQFPVRRGEYLLGRSPYCSIVIANPLASRRHCALRLTPDGLVLVDLGSANGTHVNGERLTGERPLAAGDRVRIGSEVLIVEQLDDGPQRDARRTYHETSQAPLSTSRPPTLSNDELVSDSFEEESSTVTHADTLELLEALVQSASDNERPQDLAPVIQRTVERVVRQAGTALSSEDVYQLHAIVSGVAAWFPDGSLDEWAKAVLATLGRKPS